MQERSSRYAASAGSEEIEVMPERQENDENRNPSDDDDYSPPSSSRPTASGQKRSIVNDLFDEEMDSKSSPSNQPMLETSVRDPSSLHQLTKSKYGLLQSLDADQLIERLIHVYLSPVEFT